MNSIAATDPPAESKIKPVLLTIVLQASHRLGAIALLATLATWGMMYAAKDFQLSLAVAAGSADAGLCCGLAARLITRPGDLPRREANGVAIFNLIFFVLAIYLMLITRLDAIRSAASDFFTPSPLTSPQG